MSNFARALGLIMISILPFRLKLVAQDNVIKSFAKADLKDIKDKKKFVDILADENKQTASSDLFSILKSSVDDFQFKDRKGKSISFGITLKRFINGIDSSKNRVIIIEYYSFSKDENNIAPDGPPSIESIIISQSKYQKNGWSSYLLGKKDVLIIEVNTPTQNFDNTTVKVNLKTSLTKQTWMDALTVLKAAAGPIPEDEFIQGVSLTFKEVDKTKLKAPCEIIDSVKSKELIKTLIHDKNIVTLQIGVENTNYSLKNFSISSGNLVVTPDSSQKKSWKSNLFVVAEFHLPRDVDNFQPLWKALFGKNTYEGKDKNGFYHSRLYNVTLDRIGVYGGFKVSQDPLSNLFAGFNYAISKEVYFTLGWTWTNEITPQVTSIGNITSLSDAEKYAKRKYSTGQFSWGLSFVPSAIISALGLKSK